MLHQFCGSVIPCRLPLRLTRVVSPRCQNTMRRETEALPRSVHPMPTLPPSRIPILRNSCYRCGQRGLAEPVRTSVVSFDDPLEERNHPIVPWKPISRPRWLFDEPRCGVTGVERTGHWSDDERPWFSRIAARLIGLLYELDADLKCPLGVQFPAALQTVTGLPR